MNNAPQPLFSLLLSTLSWLIPLMLVVSILRTPWAKGHIGEWFVRFMPGVNAGRQFWGCSTFPKCRVMQKI